MLDQEQLRARVESFPRWHYEFDLNGVRTPIFQPDHVNRHEQRRRYFFDPLVELCGGSLTGKRVLDLACNAGFWSLSAIEAGADFVLGIDGRQMHIDQANLVFEAKGVAPDRFDFRVGDVFTTELVDEGPFDVVLCLGLMYHVSKPFELMERISRWNSELLVIDTALDLTPGSYFHLIRENPEDPRTAVDLSVALVPTRKAVAQLARLFGYPAVKVLRPRFTSWEGAEVYRDGMRRAFICSKRAHSLKGRLRVERLQPRPPPSTTRRRINAFKRRVRRLAERPAVAGRSRG
jgi:2-polyprenyl-3-methyl-5-hydroxy-6-metoxy-1,4-benzoquinol methylase